MPAWPMEKPSDKDQDFIQLRLMKKPELVEVGENEIGSRLQATRIGYKQNYRNEKVRMREIKRCFRYAKLS